MLNEADTRITKLRANGYRHWKSAGGNVLFGKLVEFDAQNAILREESGEERKVKLNQLSMPDREVITRTRLGRPLPRRDPALASEVR